MDIRTHKQTDRNAHIYTDRQTQTNRKVDEQASRHTHTERQSHSAITLDRDRQLRQENGTKPAAEEVSSDSVDTS